MSPVKRFPHPYRIALVLGSLGASSAATPLCGYRGRAKYAEYDAETCEGCMRVRLDAIDAYGYDPHDPKLRQFC